MGRELAALRMPHQFLGREPAHALDEGALDLADVDRRVQRLACVVQDVGAQQLPFAGQRVDDHLAHRRAVGVVVERAALHLVLVPAQAGRGVEAVGPQLLAVEVGLAHHGAEGQRAAVDLDLVVGEAHRAGLAAMALGRALGQPLADLARGVLRGLAVEVGAGRSRRGRGVRDLGRVGGRDAHALEAHAELVRHHLRHLGVQALAHLGAAVVHQDRAVGVDMHQRAGLVEVLDVERDAELQRCQRQPALEHRARGVEAGDLLAPRAVVARGLELGHQLVHDVVGHGLAVGRHVVLALAVEVDAPHVERIAAQLARHRVHDVLDRDRALRAAETAEGRVALRVGLARVAVHADVGQPVGVVEVAQRARHHRARQVGRVAGARDHGDLGAEDAALVVVAHLVLVPEAVAPARDHEVVVAVQPQLDRAAQLARGHRGHAGEQRRLRFLAAEAAAHAPALHVHLVRLQVHRVRDQVLHLARMLGRAVDMQRAALLRNGVADLALEVELLLPADVERGLEPARRGRDGGAHRGLVAAVGGTAAAHDVHRRHHVLAARMRVLRRQHRRLRLDGQRVLGARGGAARGVAGARDHGEHRLAQVADLAAVLHGQQDRVVVDDRAAVVGAGDVVGREHRHHARHGADGVERERRDAPVGRGRQAQRAMQGAGDLGDVVDVGGLAGHVQVRRFVRAADAHAHALVVGERLGTLVDAGGGVLQVVGKGLCGLQQAGIEGLVHGLRLLARPAWRWRRAASRSRRWWRCRAAHPRPGFRATGAGSGSAPPASGSRPRRACRTAA